MSKVDVFYPDYIRSNVDTAAFFTLPLGRALCVPRTTDRFRHVQRPTIPRDCCVAARTLPARRYRHFPVGPVQPPPPPPSKPRAMSTIQLLRRQIESRPCSTAPAEGSVLCPRSGSAQTEALSSPGEVRDSTKQRIGYTKALNCGAHQNEGEIRRTLPTCQQMGPILPQIAESTGAEVLT